MATYDLKTGRVSGETVTTKNSADYVNFEVKYPHFAVACPICGFGTPVNYPVKDVIVCDSCKKAVAWVKKRMEEENGQDIHTE